jgi:hypothetical protein
MRETNADVSSANKIIRKSAGSCAPHTPYATAWLTVALRWRPLASHHNLQAPPGACASAHCRNRAEVRGGGIFPDTVSFRFGKEAFFVLARKELALSLPKGGVARRRTYVPPRGASRPCPCHPPRGASRSWRAVPPPKGGKGPFPDGNLFVFEPHHTLTQYILIHKIQEIHL